MKRCFKCGREWKNKHDPGFNELCEDCHSYLHCCLNCVLYNPKLSNRCKSDTTEHVSNPADKNFCEEFKFLAVSPQSEDERGRGRDPQERWDALFE
ncbi:MAG: hypothetical protein E3J72_21620 [Planctomycetota bacterium]|nr:MAG: hypothetical protein E3J72_21620 [Planctomycetota bacterium]